MTNYEKIRAMSAEEMAGMIDGWDELIVQACHPRYCDARRNGRCCAHISEEQCHLSTSKWLNSEVEE
jgi:hypothetical protein